MTVQKKKINLNIQQQFFRTIIPLTAHIHAYINRHGPQHAWSSERVKFIILDKKIIFHNLREYFFVVVVRHCQKNGSKFRNVSFPIVLGVENFTVPFNFLVECKLNDFMIWVFVSFFPPLAVWTSDVLHSF